MSTNELFDRWGTEFHSGDVVFLEGDDGERMYIIQEGSVQISKKIDNRDHLLATLEKGDFFGEMAIVSRIKRSATARALGELKLLSFDRAGFQQMIEKNSKLAMAIIDKLCRRLERTNSQLSELSAQNTTTTVHSQVLYLFKEKGGAHAELDSVFVEEEIALALQLPQSKVKEQIDSLIAKSLIERKTDKLILKDLEGFTTLVNLYRKES